MRVSILLVALSLCPVYAGAADIKPASFPVVDPTTQKARDQERIQILQDEKSEEIGLLNKAKAELAAAQTAKRAASELGKLVEDVHRHEANVAALEQEIARTGKQKATAVTAPPVRLVSAKPAAPPKAVSDVDAESQATSAPVPFWDVYRRQASNRSEGETRTKTQLSSN